MDNLKAKINELIEHCSAMNGLVCKLHDIDFQDSFELIAEINTLEIQIHKLQQHYEGLNRKHTKE